MRKESHLFPQPSMKGFSIVMAGGCPDGTYCRNKMEAFRSNAWEVIALGQMGGDVLRM